MSVFGLTGLTSCLFETKIQVSFFGLCRKPEQQTTCFFKLKKYEHDISYQIHQKAIRNKARPSLGLLSALDDAGNQQRLCRRRPSELYPGHRHPYSEGNGRNTVLYVPRKASSIGSLFSLGNRQRFPCQRQGRPEG